MASTLASESINYLLLAAALGAVAVGATSGIWPLTRGGSRPAACSRLRSGPRCWPPTAPTQAPGGAAAADRDAAAVGDQRRHAGAVPGRALRHPHVPGPGAARGLRGALGVHDRAVSADRVQHLPHPAPQAAAARHRARAAPAVPARGGADHGLAGRHRARRRRRDAVRADLPVRRQVPLHLRHRAGRRRRRSAAGRAEPGFGRDRRLGRPEGAGDLERRSPGSRSAPPSWADGWARTGGSKVSSGAWPWAASPTSCSPCRFSARTSGSASTSAPAERRARPLDAAVGLGHDLTSSATSRTSCSRRMRWTSGQWLSGGMITPPAPWSGSATKAAELLLPWLAHRFLWSERVMFGRLFCFGPAAFERAPDAGERAPRRLGETRDFALPRHRRDEALSLGLRSMEQGSRPMPLYTYQCDHHGEFAAWGKMSESDSPSPARPARSPRPGRWPTLPSAADRAARPWPAATVPAHRRARASAATPAGPAASTERRGVGRARRRLPLRCRANFEAEGRPNWDGLVSL